MDRALFRLMLLRLRGGIRNRLRQLVSLRGMAFMLVILAVGWIVVRTGSTIPPGELGGVALDDADAVRASIRTYLPIGLLGAWLFNIFAATGPAFHFSQNEIDFLFAGPFSRRSLLIYKCCIFLAGLVLTAGVLVLLIPPKTSWPPAAFFAALLTPMFIQMSGAVGQDPRSNIRSKIAEMAPNGCYAGALDRCRCRALRDGDDRSRRLGRIDIVSAVLVWQHPSGAVFCLLGAFFGTEIFPGSIHVGCSGHRHQRGSDPCHFCF